MLAVIINFADGEAENRVGTTLKLKKMTGQKTFYEMRPGERVALVESVKENNGTQSRFEAIVSPGTSAPLHYHTIFEEIFEVLQGELTVWMGNEKKVLKAGQKAVIKKKVKHKWKNESNEDCLYIGTLSPGQIAFENWLMIFAGLKKDGMLNKQGLPSSPYIVGLFCEESNTRFAGAMSVMMPLIHWLSSRGKKKGLDKMLIEKYCK